MILPSYVWAEIADEWIVWTWLWNGQVEVQTYTGNTSKCSITEVKRLCVSYVGNGISCFKASLCKFCRNIHFFTFILCRDMYEKKNGAFLPPLYGPAVYWNTLLHQKQHIRRRKRVLALSITWCKHPSVSMATNDDRYWWPDWLFLLWCISSDSKNTTGKRWRS